MSAKPVLWGILLFACCLALACSPALAEYTVSDLSGSIVRGHQFTVDITGKPNTSYYVWLTGTWPLTGEAYDEPPIIVPNQYNVEQDPESGPYTIGSYQYYNGNGRTILDDVAPTSSLLSKTSYYALVTTDSAGQATVAFGTSVNTALRSYPVRVENPTLVNTDTLLVERGDTKVTKGSISITAASRPTRPETTVTTAGIPALTSTAPTEVMVTPEQTAPATTPVSTQKAPVDAALCMIAAGIALMVAMKR